MENNKKIVAILPAYNTEKTLKMTVDAISSKIVDEIIVVDDGSQDKTREVAERLGVRVLSHAVNRGYGASQKTGYQAALKSGADVTVMVHSDFQYDPTLIPEIVRPIIEGEADVCFGSRMLIKKNALKGSMPWWRFIANIALGFIEDLVLGLGLSDYHTGYRAYSREVLDIIPFLKNSDNYVFDTEMIAQLSVGRFRVSEIAIPTRYFNECSSPSFLKSVEYGIMTLGVLVKYLLHVSRIRRFPLFMMNDQVLL